MKHTLVGIFLFLSSLSFSQDRGFYSEGREFLLGYLHNPYIDSLKFGHGGDLSITAIISSNQMAKLQVSYYDASGKETSPTPYTLKDNNSLQIPLTRTNMMYTNYNGDVPEYTACHITCDVPVTVSYMSYGQLAFGSYLALPIVSWGKKYVVASYNDHPGYFSVVHQGAGNTEAFYSCGVFTIVGAYNGTKVQITPTALTRGGHVGVNQGPGNNGTPKPYTIELNKGQCYLVKSASAIADGTDDISATTISADKPIGVISGHQDAAVGDGNSNGFETDGRDFMIEQLVPVEFWDNKGIYTIPMLESKGNPIEGAGENYRVYVSDVSVPASVQVHTSATTYDEVYPHTFEKAVELTNRTKPLAFTSQNDSDRFSVMQYELRSQFNASSYTSPSMTTIVPRSQWKNSYTWRGYKSHIRYADAFQNYYVTVIADANDFENIKVVLNGGNPLSIHNALNPAVRTWSSSTIPGGGNLKAVTYGIDIAYNTSYYAYSDKPFMVYQFGYSAADGSGDLGGQIESEDYFGTDSHPAGMRLFDKTKANSLSVKVDTLCNGWNICVSEGSTDGGVRFITMIDDSLGALYPGRSMKFKNCSLSPEVDPLGLNEIILLGNNPHYCFSITADYPDQNVYAPIAIYDNGGNYKLLELRMQPKAITVSPTVSKGLYGKPALGKTVCKEYVVKNLINNTEPMEIESVSTVSPFFQLQSVTPSAPTALKPGDSLVVTVCYSSVDQMNHIDRLTVKAGCNTIQIPLEAQSFAPIISAKDLSFGMIDNGIKSCKEVEVRNEGYVDFSITGLELQSNQRFTLDQTSIPPFPWLIPAGGSKKIRICYTSEESVVDTAIILWKTDISAPFSSENKDRSVIIAQGQGTTGVSDQPGFTSLTVSIYPQPARDNVTIEVTLIDPSPVSITFYDVLGKTVLRKANQTADEGMNRYRIKTRELPAGTYTVVVHAGVESSVKRVVVE